MGRLIIFGIIILSTSMVFSQGIEIDSTGKPSSMQLYPRGEDNNCIVPYNIDVSGTDFQNIELEVFTNNTLSESLTSPRTSGGSYSYFPKIKAGLVDYKFNVNKVNGNTKTLVESVDSIVCGDAYIMDGQSNTAAQTVNLFHSNSDWDPPLNPYLRSLNNNTWGLGTIGNTTLKVGAWGFELGISLIDSFNIPIAIINGAVGGTRVDQHLRNETNPTANNIYGRLLQRAYDSKLDKHFKALLWHQGESDQGATQTTYIETFNTVYNSWKEDYPNVSKFYIWQIGPAACGGAAGSSTIRDFHRQLYNMHDDIEMVSAIGAEYYDGCHYFVEGYQQMAEMVFRPVARDFYNVNYAFPVNAPNIQWAAYTSTQKNEIRMYFDQEVMWEDSLKTSTPSTQDLYGRVGSQFLKDYFYLDGQNGSVTAGRDSGNFISVVLNGSSTATKLTYIERAYEGGNIAYGGPFILGKGNLLAALTFKDLEILDQPGPVSVDPKKFVSGSSFKLEGIILNKTLHLNTSKIKGSGFKVNILNMTGQKVYQETFRSQTNNSIIGINLEPLTPGLYILSVGYGKETQRLKLMIP